MAAGCGLLAFATRTELATCTGNDPQASDLSIELFKQIDTDGDGRRELQALFTKVDTDKDGVVSKAEFRAALLKHGAPSERIEELFQRLDEDGSGTLDISEFEKGSRDGPARNIAYARGFVQSFLTKGRFVAYTSDIGESARPVMSGWFVNACYGLTFLYVGVAVGSHTFEAYTAGEPTEMVARAAVHVTTFEVIASVLMPSLIIHQVVHFAHHHAHRLPPGNVTKWVPSLVGLCCIPFLPYLDYPAEVVIDRAFEVAWPKAAAPEEED